VDVQAAVDQVLDGVGDLELAARRGPDPLDRVKDVAIEHINAHERQVGARLRGFLDQLPDLLAVLRKLGDTELLRIGDLGEEDLGGAALGL